MRERETQLLSAPADPILICGPKISRGGKHENEAAYKLVHEGQYVAEVEVELMETNEGWSPYLSLEDTYKLDDVRSELRCGDLKAATRLARVFSLTPVNA